MYTDDIELPTYLSNKRFNTSLNAVLLKLPNQSLYFDICSWEFLLCILFLGKFIIMMIVASLEYLYDTVRRALSLSIYYLPVYKCIYLGHIR